ncbi:D-alanyl-D-alanine carboxypeptidase/D-alanyl-D-alanine endopeptidase [Halalkalibacter urbisdiaboli]|uniref:D-alanyl-D-alanine carboxypeptidase/D-alanyl-D-alanine endopeptidase n=1 Tax=Halalkalibacter urbisdiaboli TaxID=1960589 RepID=UPI003CCA396A
MKKTLFMCILFIFITNVKVYAVDTNWKQELTHFLMNEALKGSTVGISVRSANTGEILFQYNGDKRLRPASNMKLITGAVAMARLGENYTFHTELLNDGKIRWNVLNGNLYVRGKGDPTLLPSDIRAMAKELKNQGVRFITGDLIGDDTWYDNQRYPIDLVWSDETKGYGAQTSALTVSSSKNYDAGTVKINIMPQNRLGNPAIITVSPNTEYVHIENYTKVVPESELNKLIIERIHGTNTITIKGAVPLHTNGFKKTIAVWEPTEMVLELFKKALKAEGIHLIGDVKIGKTPQEVTIISVHKSIPLSELFVPFMKLSNNGHAETLVKELGKTEKNDGSWEAGLEVILEQLATFQIDTDTLVIRDGSGISHVNLVPANQLTKLLYTIQEEKWFKSYLHSLPVAGINSDMIGGTLQNRLEGVEGKVIAKTGTISTVSTLAGYLETDKDERLIFAILLNNLTNNSDGKAIEDQIVKIISE